MMKRNFFQELLDKLQSADPQTLNQIGRISRAVSAFSAGGLVLLKAMDNSSVPRLTYLDLLKLFEDNKIADYHLDMSSRHLMFRRRGKNVTEMTTVPDTALFLQDVHQKVKNYNDEHPEKPIRMDYTHGIPTWVIAALSAAVIALYVYDGYLLARSQNGPALPVIKEDPRQTGFVRSNFSMEPAGSTTFEDVAGMEEEKEELREVVEYLRDPEKFRKLGARVPKGVLLIGPPGTGKTLLARAVAGEAGVPFFSISGSEFVEMFVGVGAARVRDLFKRANESAPAIIFIDEIDAIARRRGSDLFSGNEERETTLNQLLVEMDGFEKNTGVIVMAATNRKDILDPALLRPGRFDRQIYIGVPDSRGREAILKVHSKDKPLAEDVDLGVIARATTGFTGADLSNLLNEAALLAARRSERFISMSDMEEAIMKVIAGPEKRSRVVTPHERRLTAIHEAGHAVAMYFLPTCDPVHQITIIPRGPTGGMTVSLPQEDRLYATRQEMFEDIVAFLGGRIAEQLRMNDISTGASNDIERATAKARDMVARYGMSERLGAVSYSSGEEIFVGRDYEKTKAYSERTAGDIDAEVKTIMDEAYAKCTQILTEHGDKLDEVAAFLLEHEHMSRSQFLACMEGQAIPAGDDGLLDSFKEENK